MELFQKHNFLELEAATGGVLKKKGVLKIAVLTFSR